MQYKKFYLNTVTILATVGLVATVGFYFFSSGEISVNAATTKINTAQGKINLLKVTKNFQDFQFDAELNGQSAYIADLPAGTEIQSLYSIVTQDFLYNDGSFATFDLLNRRAVDLGMCSMGITGSLNEQRQGATHAICDLLQSSSILLRDSSAKNFPLVQGQIDLYISYINF